MKIYRPRNDKSPPLSHSAHDEQSANINSTERQRDSAVAVSLRDARLLRSRPKFSLLIYVKLFRDWPRIPDSRAFGVTKPPLRFSSFRLFTFLSDTRRELSLRPDKLSRSVSPFGSLSTFPTPRRSSLARAPPTYAPYEK